MHQTSRGDICDIKFQSTVLCKSVSSVKMLLWKNMFSVLIITGKSSDSTEFKQLMNCIITNTLSTGPA